MANRHMKRCSALLLVEKGKSTLQGGTTSYRSEWPSLDSWRKIDAGEGVEKRETLLHCWGSISWCSHHGKQYGSSSKKQKQSFHMIRQFQSQAYIWKETIPWKDSCTSMFIAAKLTIAKTWKQPNCPLTGEWRKKMYILTDTWMEYHTDI